MTARTCLAIALIWAPILVTAATCEGIENVEERMSCLEEQYCTDSTSDAECYEAIVRRLLTGTTPTVSPEETSPTVTPPAAAPEIPQPGSEQAVTTAEETPAELEDATVQPGKPDEDTEDLFGRKPELPREEPNRITANIAAVFEEHDGRLLVGLDNGQVWEENEPPGRPRRIKIGSEVGVSKIMFGYILRFDNGTTVRVSRLECDSRHADANVLSKCRRAGYGSMED